jgi:hypothetical protein
MKSGQWSVTVGTTRYNSRGFDTDLNGDLLRINTHNGFTIFNIRYIEKVEFKAET